MKDQTVRDRWLRWGAYALGALCLGQLVTFLALAPAGGAALEAPLNGGWRHEIPFVVEMALGGVLGAVLAAHRPRNPVGWLMGLLSLGFLGFDVVVAVVASAAPTTPLWVRLVAWTGNWVWLLGHAGAIFLLLVLPNGTALTSRWGMVGRVGVGVLATLGVVAALVPGPLEATPEIVNPFGVAGVDVAEPLFGVLLLAMLLVELLAAASLVLRFVRSRGPERQQLKWIAYGVVVLVATQVGEQAGLVPRVLAPLGGLATTGAVVVAVTRHRLYEIDRLVSRTVTYTLVTAILVGVYAGLVVTLQAIVDPLATNSDLAVAGSTLAAAALFGPLRRHVQRLVDRRFNRARYNATQAVAAFGQRLRDEVDLATAVLELETTVASTVQPATVSLWIPPATADLSVVTVPSRSPGMVCSRSVNDPSTKEGP